MQVDDDHVTLLGGGGGRGTGVGVRGRRQGGQFPGVPEVAHSADREHRQDHDEGDQAAAGAALGLLAALGAVLGEVQPVDDVLGVAVRLFHERELPGVVLPLGRPAVSGRTAPVGRRIVGLGVGLELVLDRTGLLRDVSGLLGDTRMLDPGLLSAGGGLPVGVVRGLGRGSIGVVADRGLPTGVVGGRLLTGVVRVVGGRLLPARGVRVIAIALPPCPCPWFGCVGRSCCPYGS